jgi:outer membrane protein TolC
MDADVSNQPLEALVSHALQNRDELKAAEAQADALSAQARAEAGKLLPQVALTGSYTHFDNQILDREDFAMVGIGVTWSLFDDQTRHRSSALISASRAQHERLADLQSQIALEVRRDWLEMQETRARLGAMGEAVSQADENLRISRQLYDAGQAANTQVLDAVALQVEATKNRDDAMLDESLSRLRLARAIGEL